MTPQQYAKETERNLKRQWGRAWRLLDGRTRNYERKQAYFSMVLGQFDQTNEYVQRAKALAQLLDEE